ncbi:hypothetical protein VPH35_087451 [Triticum aestivum]|uniref:uncharacterized protein n=1 Tax=Triticum aestivum TaxID=4565 RepID=UPI001D015AFF|nr:uncharacterized protein LOC123101870 [Triticum aestivum]
MHFHTTFEPWILLSKQLGFEVWGPKIVKRYQRETIAMCLKDGVLPNNWNLITFSVGLLECATHDNHLWGARVLDTFTRKGIPIRQELLSSSQAIKNLFDVVGLTRTDNPETRERATRIVADLASELRITQFPDALRCICYLLESCNHYSDPEVAHLLGNFEQTLDKTTCKVSVETFEHSHHQEDAHLSLPITEQTNQKHLPSDEFSKIKSWIQTMMYEINKFITPQWDRYFGDKYHYSYVSKGTKELISQGLVILERLTQDEDNCTEIIRHQRLLSKITLPLCYQDLLGHRWDHTWAEMLRRSLTVLSRLIRGGPREDSTRLRHDMFRNTIVIRNLMRILEVDCEGAFSELRVQAIEILTELAYVDSFRKLAFDQSTSMTEMFVKTLRRIFLEDRDGDTIVAKYDEDKDTRARTKAGEALARLLRAPSARDNTDALISATNVDIVDLLPMQDVDVVDLLPKQDVINLLTKVVGQILSTKAKNSAHVAAQTGATNSNCHIQSQTQKIPAARQSSTQGYEEESESRNKLATMLSLTVAICNNNAISGDDFTRGTPEEAHGDSRNKHGYHD